MKLFLLQNKQIQKRNNYIELFGLSRAGKSTLLKNIKKTRKINIYNLELTALKKLFYLAKFSVSFPIKTIKLFYKLNSNWIYTREISFLNYMRIFLMRNSYLSHVLAKYEIIKEKDYYVDEFLMQSLFMIIQKKSNEKEILNVFGLLPPPSNIILVEESKKKRYERIAKTRYPAQQINKDYAVEWMKNMEFNYKIIRKILLDNHISRQVKNLDEL